MTELGGTGVLVTGATSGLGLAMARALVAASARVAITSRDAERATRTVNPLFLSDPQPFWAVRGGRLPPRARDQGDR